jgi:DNA-binding response OmpR family regulator
MLNILLVHPDMAVTDKLRFLLRHSGFRVAAAAEAQQAMAELAKAVPT